MGLCVKMNAGPCDAAAFVVLQVAKRRRFFVRVCQYAPFYPKDADIWVYRSRLKEVALLRLAYNLVTWSRLKHYKQESQERDIFASRSEKVEK